MPEISGEEVTDIIGNKSLKFDILMNKPNKVYFYLCWAIASLIRSTDFDPKTNRAGALLNG